MSALLASGLLLVCIPGAITAQDTAGVIATIPNGATNPPAPFLAAVGSLVNQTSYSRLVTLNSVDDFCLFGPPEAGPDSTIGNVEATAVAYCTQARNGARLIPDGTIESAHFIKTPMYVQIQGKYLYFLPEAKRSLAGVSIGYFDGTRIGIPAGDDGGELDPHGAENLGNPIGGNVTSNVTGSDEFYQEWMSYISYNQFCLRICTSNRKDVNAALQCEHELDVMGCQWAMPGDYTNGTFDSCEGEAAAPPGSYPENTSRQGQYATATSTFRQRYTGTWTAESTTGTFTVGQTVTPAAPAYTPATSSCTHYATIFNGINTAGYRVVALGTQSAVTSQHQEASTTAVPTSTSFASAPPFVSSSAVPVIDCDDEE